MATGDGRRPYDTSLEPANLKIAAAGIIVLSEADSTSPEFQAAAEMIRTAGHVVFLGCAYHKPNMKRLPIPSVAGAVHPSRLGSGAGMTTGGMDVVRKSWGIQVLAETNLAFLRQTVALQPDLYRACTQRSLGHLATHTVTDATP